MLLGMLLVPASLTAQDVIRKDSMTANNNKEVANRNVLQNASSADQPRQINLGLPSSNTGATIFEDGVPVSYNSWPDIPYSSWFGGTAFGRIGVMSIGETALQYGSPSFAVKSTSRRSDTRLGGIVNYQVNNYGRQVFDAVASSPLGKGWGVLVNTYQVWDPGTADIRAAEYQTRNQSYRFLVDRHFAQGRGYMRLQYQFSRSIQNSAEASPFIFVGDGSVKKYNGIAFGTDAYYPNQANFITYRDIMTGEIKTKSWKDAGTTDNHQIAFSLDYRFKNGNNLSFVSRLKLGDASMARNSASGITSNVGGYFNQDGTPYTGEYVQNYYLMYVPGFERTWFNTVMLSGKSHSGKHNWRLGANIWYNRAGVQQMNSTTSSEVAENPNLLYRKDADGRLLPYNGLNPYGGEYYDGHDSKFAVIASDDWRPNDKFFLSLGTRLEYNTYAGDAAFSTETVDNHRTRSWWIGANPNGGITRFHGDWITPTVSLSTHYSIIKGFGLTGEYVYSMQRPTMKDFAGATLPTTAPVNVNIAHAGIFWNNSWISLTSQFAYVSQTNYKARTTFYHVLQSDATDGSGLKAGDEQSKTLLTTYNIRTLGWTTDFVLTPFKGFSLHGFLTLQKPTYQKFNINAAFADGVTDHADVSGNIVTAMSKVLMEIDPSYSWNKWRLSLNFRYFSKQYINKTNSLYFNGHWETFGSLSYALNKKIQFAANVVNFLNQNGASGSISAADLVTDPSKYKNFLMAGSHIRPFQVTLSTTINF